MKTEDILTELLRREGGYTQDKADKAHYGKAVPPHKWDSYCTNMGITQETLSAYYGRQASIDEVKNLSPSLAREIYVRIFLDGTGIHRLPEALVPFVFDAAVNHGERRAIAWLQDVCNMGGYLPPLQDDGALGPKTYDAVQKIGGQLGYMFLAAYLEQRRNFYYQLLADPAQQKYKRGWLNRVLEFYYDVLSMAPNDEYIKAQVAALQKETA